MIDTAVRVITLAITGDFSEQFSPAEGGWEFNYEKSAGAQRCVKGIQLEASLKCESWLDP